MTSTRFLTGSLATLAIASAFTLAAPAAQAADELDRPCGQPEIAAVYETVVLPPVFRTVPAVVHSEWLWEREVPTYEFEFSKQLSPAAVENDWTRKVTGPTEYLFTRTVIDSPAVPGIPAVPEVGHWETVVITPEVVSTEVEYQHERNGQLRWEDEDWGAQNGDGMGWTTTGNTRPVVLIPAVTTLTYVIDVPGTPAVPAIPEVSHLEELWAAISPGADWTQVDERPGATTTEKATTDGDAPAGAGWTLVETRNIDAVIDTVWAFLAPDGYTPTGASQVAGSNHEETAVPAAAAPAGDGWTKVEASEVVVTDIPEQQELVTPGSVQDVLVSAAVPATEPCVAPPTGPSTDEVAPPAADDGPAAQGAAAATGTVLPNTGNDVAPWMAPAGLAVMLAGIGVIRMSRRVTA